MLVDVKIYTNSIVTPYSWQGMARSGYSKVVNLSEDSKMALSVFQEVEI